ncbi:isoamylase early set domain-containing protein [Streptomyces sp. NBC_00193]|uniref:isoamylase early set domain-containing protein n=1 Tax=Streptomyces sp. NBC_00193 TaxID=2975675 RepID=UPI0022579C52|nr:isoamylase early set domain-containing protein [Streptomyces sp. NBC_00193]MCX5300341.1 isoamylase early set domain-containing protein [Streptomyces sp. NBC_00193]
MLERTWLKKQTEITFVLPAGHPAGEVSVVGDFTDWQPGPHPLAEQSDGSRSVTVTLPVSQHHQFRYLADGGHCLDEEEADGHDGCNSLLHT